MRCDRRNYARPTKLIYECRNSREIPLRLPTKFRVCPTCDGRGSYVNPAIDEHGISAEEMHDDPDFAESYFSGAYDVTCAECLGKNVIETIDQEKLVTSSQTRRFKLFCAQIKERKEIEREDRVTAYYESGGRE